MILASVVNVIYFNFSRIHLERLAVHQCATSLDKHAKGST